MGTILFECPITGRPVSTGIETEPISLPPFENVARPILPALWAFPWGENLASGNVRFDRFQQYAAIRPDSYRQS